MHSHPHHGYRDPRATHAVGDVLGYRRDGRPIYPIAGGSGDDDGGGNGGGDDPRGTPDPGNTPDDQPGQQQGQPGSAGAPSDDEDGDRGGSVDELPAWAQREIRQARKGEGDKRTKLRSVEQQLDQYKSTLDKLRQALDPDGGDNDDPATLAERAQQERDEKDQALRQKAIELEVYRKAAGHNADPDALLDSRTFLAAASKLDVDSDDFADELDSAIRQAVDNNSKLRAGQAPPRSSGSEFTGGSGGSSDRRPKDLADALQRHYRG